MDPGYEVIRTTYCIEGCGVHKMSFPEGHEADLATGVAGHPIHARCKTYIRPEPRLGSDALDWNTRAGE